MGTCTVGTEMSLPIFKCLSKSACDKGKGRGSLLWESLGVVVKNFLPELETATLVTKHPTMMVTAQMALGPPLPDAPRTVMA